jgi:hypothetical protein
MITTKEEFISTKKRLTTYRAHTQKVESELKERLNDLELVKLAVDPLKTFNRHLEEELLDFQEKYLNLRRFGPKQSNHPTVGKECPACDKPFEEGDYTTLVTLGPGDDKEQQEKCREGRPYNAVASEVHWECAGGIKVGEL